MLIHKINLTGHRKSACCLQLLVFLGIWVIAPFWHWRTQVFPRGCCHHDLKAFLWNWVWKCFFVCYRKYEVKMTRILLKFIIYPSCERDLKNGRVKLKILRKLSFGDMTFLTSHDYIWLFFICFLCCAKEGIIVEISKVSQPLEKPLPLCKGGRKCKNKFSNPSLLHPAVF